VNRNAPVGKGNALPLQKHSNSKNMNNAVILLPSLVSAPTTPVACEDTSDGKRKRHASPLLQNIQIQKT
jgi:hypothetical protein